MTHGKPSVQVLQVAGIEQAMHWMRYAKQTHSDTEGLLCHFMDKPVIGPRDMRLAQALIKAPRDSHAKMCRVIMVWLDIVGTLKWWKQFDTYKIGTTALSTSTMNNLMDGVTEADYTDLVAPEAIELVQKYIRLDDEDRANANNPVDFLQLRGVVLNYQVLRNIWIDRKKHKLGEWHNFLDAIRDQCPYADELIFVQAKITLEQILSEMGGSIAPFPSGFIWTADAAGYDAAWEQKCEMLEYLERAGVTVDDSYSDQDTTQVVFQL